MLDYSQYQGPSFEWDVYVRKNPLPKADYTLPPQTIRQATNALRVQISQAEVNNESLQDLVHWRDHSILTRDSQSIIARVYTPKIPTQPPTQLPIYLYFHGGGHLLGVTETEDAACARLAAHANIVVASINYRHTPEFTHPTQVNDAWDAFGWLARNAAGLLSADPARVIVGGISAGAGLAASVVLRHHTMRRRGDPATLPVTVVGQLLCIPWLVHPDNYPFNTGPGWSLSSYVQNQDAPVLPMPLLRLFTDLLRVENPADPELNVGLASDNDVSGLPRTGFLVAGQDLLRDEGLHYADKLSKNG